MAKKIILLALMMILLSGCGSKDDSNNKTGAAQGATETSAESASKEIDIDINEEMYIEWINEIYINADSYLGQRVHLEGMFLEEEDPDNGNSYTYVYRQGPGCCGTDGGMCGFEFTYDGIMPEDNDWIEVTGILTKYEENGVTYLSLEAESVRVKEERGSEILTQ